MSTCVVNERSKIESVSEKGIHSEVDFEPLLLNLDLSILAYHLYSQTLVWPFDPYYEISALSERERKRFIDRVWAWLASESNDESRAFGLSGPGVLTGRPSNLLHDPILYKLKNINPWESAVVFTGQRFSLFSPQEKLLEPIKSLYLVSGANNKITMLPVQGADELERDVLIAFEGETGGKGEPDAFGSQSLMGFVLLKHHLVKKHSSGAGYDVHIVFRGSRSGSAERAFVEALSDKSATGNPDWITDLGYNLIGLKNGGGLISTQGRVARGFAYSMKSILPQLIPALEKIAELKQGVIPENM